MKPSSLFFRAASAALLTVLAIASRPTARAYDSMVVFGDSLSDNGNLALTVGPALFTAQDYDPLRVTDGPTTFPSSAISGVMVEQLNAMLGLPPLNPFVNGGSNYAWAYAKTGFETFDLLSTTTPGTGTQVGAYLLAHPAASATSLYVMWAGANDLTSASTAADMVTAETQAHLALRNQIGALLASGARNILWANLPDLSLTPFGAASSAEIRTQLHNSSQQFRNDWAVDLLTLQTLYPTAHLTGLDVYGIMQNLVANPALYGLSNVTNSARGNLGVNPDTYLFWDDLHPTTKADAVLARLAFEQLQPVPEPSGSIYLVIALIGIALRRRFVARQRGFATTV